MHSETCTGRYRWSGRSLNLDQGRRDRYCDKLTPDIYFHFLLVTFKLNLHKVQKKPMYHLHLSNPIDVQERHITNWKRSMTRVNAHDSSERRRPLPLTLPIQNIMSDRKQRKGPFRTKIFHDILVGVGNMQLAFVGVLESPPPLHGATEGFCLRPGLPFRRAYLCSRYPGTRDRARLFVFVCFWTYGPCVSSKPARYGIKIFAMADARVFYALNMEIYRAKQPPEPYQVNNSPSEWKLSKGLIANLHLRRAYGPKAVSELPIRWTRNHDH
ncbi:hypothetical protein J6590_103803 [Homalodisca vitripennis]|nr:hypothetical protein J6590_103803 [Homalodisca vitripennis]